MARMFLMKCYLMLQNVRVTAFTVSELLRKKAKIGKRVRVGRVGGGGGGGRGGGGGGGGAGVHEILQFIK